MELTPVKNPLEQFFPVENRTDGVYVKIDPSHRNSLNFDEVVAAVYGANVLNFHPDQLRNAFLRARGTFERISPVFEYLEEDLDTYIRVYYTPEKASIRIQEGLFFSGIKPSFDQLMRFLEEKGITYGINEEQVRSLCTTPECGKHVVIAEAKPPERGVDASLEIIVAVTPDVQPEIKSDGSVDYRNIRTFTSVAKGELLAVKTPATPGKPGIAVNGEPIAPVPGADIDMPRGRNTVVSENGNELYSEVNGIVYYQSGLLTVGELLNIPNDVDYSVGNIKYSGEVLVNGSVKPGFTIEAEGMVQVKGDVESATIISRAGEVMVMQGILGKGETVIKAKKGVTIAFAQDAKIETDGPVRLRKHLIHCDVRCQRLEEHREQKASVIGGMIQAERSITVSQCGNEKEVRTDLTIFDKNKAAMAEKLKQLEQLKRSLEDQHQIVEQHLKTKAGIIKKTGGSLTRQLQEELKKKIDEYNALKKKIPFVATRMEEVRRTLKNPGEDKGYIHITGKCFPGTVVSLYDVSLPITGTCRNSYFRLVDGAVQDHPGDIKM